jgi:phosphoglycolate phosphatase
MYDASAILFDLDGTLIDTAGDIAAALDALLVESGRQALGEVVTRGLVGDGARVLIQKGWRASGASAPLPAELDALTRRWFAIYEADIARASRPYPGVIETLATLRARGKKLAVVTNKADRPTAKLLAALKLDGCFDAVVGGDVPFRKPDPRHVRVGLAALGVSAPDALFVGDSPNDAHAARAAGLRFLAVPYGYAHGPVDALGADRTLANFGELTEAIR